MKRRPSKARRYWRKIAREELARLAFVNARRMPQVVNDGGRRKRWVGIGWVDEGEATGRECRIIEARR